MPTHWTTLGAVALVLLLVKAATFAPLRRGRRLRLTMRFGAALLIGAGLAGVHPRQAAPPVRVELVDVSASFRPREPLAERFLDLIRPAAIAEGARIIRFNFAETAVRAGAGPPGSPTAMPGAEGTDIAGAIQAALAAGASDVILLSDGLATTEGTVDAAEQAARRGVPVSVYLPETVLAPSLSIEAVHVPERVVEGETVEVRVILRWTGPGKLRTRLHVANDAREVTLAGGGDRGAFDFRLEAARPGLMEIPVSLEPRPEADPVPEDERARPAVLVEPRADTLVVGDERPSFAARASLVQPADLPVTAAGLSAFGAVILCDVSAEALGASRAEALAGYVSGGGGLLVLGARHAYAAGRYGGTPLERVLPVTSEPPRERGRLALAIAMDRSGSMNDPVSPGVTKFQAALQALTGPLGTLSGEDAVAVILFDRRAEVVRPAAPLGSAAALVSELARVRVGGETDVFPGLEAALEAARAPAADRRHVVLLTDGRSEATPDAGAALGALQARQDVSVSVIAVGADADRRLLERVAERVGGRYLEASAATDALRDVLDRELDPRRPPPVVEGPVSVRGGPPVAVASRVTARPGAFVRLEMPGVGPLLAEQRSGAGMAAAYASSDAAPYREPLGEVLRRISAPRRVPGFTISIAPEGRALVLEATAPTSVALVARLATPGDPERDVPLVEQAPRRHRARVERPPGPVLATLVEQAPSLHSDATALASAVFAPPRPLETVPAPPDASLLASIARTTGGVVLGSPQAVPPPREVRDGAVRTIVPGAALAAACLLLLDLGAEVLLTRSRERLI